MLLRNTFLVFILCFAGKLYAQTLNYYDVLQTAMEHRQTQNAANVIIWNTAHYLLNMDSFYVDQEKELLTVSSGRHLVKYNIKIIGTYDLQDSTFLWSVSNKSIKTALTAPVYNLFSVAAANNWRLPTSEKVKCSLDSAWQFAILAFYFDHANGMNHIRTNGGRTIVLFTFYEVEVMDNISKKMVVRIPVKKQYEMIAAPEAINLCKRYFAAFDSNEKKYYQLYKTFGDDGRYLDTMLDRRIVISDTYWDTSSVSYTYFRKNRLQASRFQDVINWRAIAIGEDHYVLYDEKQEGGALHTWAFKICKINNNDKICNEYACFQ